MQSPTCDRHVLLTCQQFRCVQAFIDSSPEQLQRVVTTNMAGTLLCTRAAMKVMQKQDSGGHIFNMDGAGADGMPTPQYAAYGATKAGAWKHRNLLTIWSMCNVFQCLADMVMAGTTGCHSQITNDVFKQRFAQ